MQMIRAIIRPEKVAAVVDALEREDYVSLTKTDVFGRGKQRGIHTAELQFNELPKTMLMLVVEDADKDKVLEIIMASARTGKYGDGKIFVNPVESAYTVRTGASGL